MDGPQPQTKRADIINSNHYISNLPADLKEIILMKLSIKEAVRTSILSSKWKDSWTSIPNLVFIGDKRCEVPSRFFSCSALKSVKLLGCIINVPRFFNGFALLHTLWLHNFDLLGFDIEKLVLSCPLLEHLDLDCCFQQGCLRILAPKLIFLAIRGGFHDICLETPKLIGGIICLHGGIVDCRTFSAAKDGKESNITRALGHLSNIQKLAIWGEFIDYLAMGPIPKNLPAMFNHLSKLSVGFSNGPNEIAPALYLFQNAPNLKELQIKLSCFFDPPYVKGLWESKVIRDCLFKRLEVVNITYCVVFGSLDRAKSMLEFAKLVLSTAPLLEKFRVTMLKDHLVVFKELKLFPKLSEKCKIVLLKNSGRERWLCRNQ